jgi:O-antigen ligase
MADPGHGVPVPHAGAPVQATEGSEIPRSARIAAWGLVTLAVLSPWALGSVTPSGVRAVSVLSLTLALGVALHEAWRGGVVLPRVPLWPLLALVLAGLLQIVSWPASLHRLAAPGSAAVWHPPSSAAAAFLGEGARPISVEPAATRAWLGMVAGVCGTVLLAAPALGRRYRLIRTAWILVAAGTAVAVYGIVARAMFGPLLFGTIVVPTVAPFGPFVNKNHFAGYVVMPALVALGLGRGLWRQSASASPSGAATPRPSVLVAFAAAAVMAMAALLSLSRGGALGLLCGAVVFAIVDVSTSRTRGPKTKLLGLVVVGALLAIVLAVLPGEVHDRLFRTRLGDDSSTSFRMDTWQDAGRAFIASPLLGQGLGAFAEILPRYKTGAGLLRVEHPENEILEIAVEGGLVALVAAGIAIVVTLVRVVRSIRGHRDRVVRGVVTGAVAGVAALAVHGLVDFNLRIPSNAIMLGALMALAVAPLGPTAWRGPRRWVPAALVAVAAMAYATKTEPNPILNEARAFAVKGYAPAQGGDSLRIAMADRRVRDYVRRRPADPEGWLLAAWTTGMRGDPAGAQDLAAYAITLDPQRASVLTAARPLMASPPP